MTREAVSERNSSACGVRDFKFAGFAERIEPGGPRNEHFTPRRPRSIAPKWSPTPCPGGGALRRAAAAEYVTDGYDALDPRIGEAIDLVGDDRHGDAPLGDRRGAADEARERAGVPEPFALADRPNNHAEAILAPVLDMGDAPLRPRHLSPARRAKHAFRRAWMKRVEEAREIARGADEACR